MPAIADSRSLYLVSEPGDPPPNDPGSAWHRRIPGIRYVSSAAAIIGGVVVTVRALAGWGEDQEGACLVAAGIALILLGLASIPVFRWMDKRRR